MKMEDVELILRFLALRHLDNFRGGMQDFLDRYMIRSQGFNPEDLAFLETSFKTTVTICCDLFEENVFRSYDATTGQWQDRPHKSLADAEMVAVSRHLDKATQLRSKKAELLNATQALFQRHPPGTFTGAANTKEDVQNRIRLFEQMIAGVLQG